MNRLAAAELVHVPAVVLGELRAGFELGDRLLQNMATLEAFLAESFVRIVTIDAKVAVNYGRLFASLRKAGTPVPLNDIWIAACAQQIGAPVLTFDRDFTVMPGLDVELLPPRS